MDIREDSRSARPVGIGSNNVKPGRKREDNKAISALVKRLKDLASDRSIDPPRWVGVNGLLD